MRAASSETPSRGRAPAPASAGGPRPDRGAGLVGRALAVWLGMMALAIANGGVRVALLIPRFGDRLGHVVSTLTLCLLILALAWATIRWVGPAGGREAWLVGLGWLGMTLAFEFLAGHYLFGASWETLLADYDVRRGRVWPLVPATTLLAPVVARRLRRRDPPGERARRSPGSR